MIGDSRTIKHSTIVVEENSRYYSYVRYFDTVLEEMQELVNQGAKIVWAKTKNWCTICGKVFNVSKDMWEKRSQNGRIIHSGPNLIYKRAYVKRNAKQ